MARVSTLLAAVALAVALLALLVSVGSAKRGEARALPEIVVVPINWPINGSNVAYLAGYLRRLQFDGNVRGVVLLIDSPGGTLSATEALYTELAGLNKTKYAVIEGLGASGAYYTAVAAERIYATPSAWVGSVGVVLTFWPDVYLLEASDMVYTTGPLKLYGRDLLDLYNDVEAARENFLAAVERGRGGRLKSVEAVETAALFNAREALQLGLIDAIGGLWDAVRDMAARLGLRNYTVVDLYQKYGVQPLPAAERLSVDPGGSPTPPIFYIYPPALQLSGGLQGVQAPQPAPLPGKPYVVLDAAHGNAVPPPLLETLLAELAPRGYWARWASSEEELLRLLPNASGLVVVNPTRPFSEQAARAVAEGTRRGLRVLYMADARVTAYAVQGALVAISAASVRPEVHNLLALFNMSVLPRSVYNGSAQGGSVTENWQFVKVVLRDGGPIGAAGRLVLYSPTPVAASAPFQVKAVGEVRGYGRGNYTVVAVSGNFAYVGSVRSFTPYFLALGDNGAFFRALVGWLVGGRGR